MGSPLCACDSKRCVLCGVFGGAKIQKYLNILADLLFLKNYKTKIVFLFSKVCSLKCGAIKSQPSYL